jgi:peptidyl-tRNA hydrolase, PTH1 family
MPPETWLIVGLGNPGENYRFTRHNVGFRTVEALALDHGVDLREKGEAILGNCSLGGHEAVLFFPQTYMNESGRAVAPFLRYRNIPLENLLVVTDDLDLPVGKIRLRTSGGSGGHHGLDSIISHLQGREFPRLRIGVGKPPSPEAGPDHVLSGFPPGERERIDRAVERAARGIELLVREGAEAAMRELNREAPEEG